MDVIEKLIKLDQESNKRFEEQTKKWLEMEEKREETRTIREEQHEEWMLSMFSSVMNRYGNTAGPFSLRLLSCTSLFYVYY